VAFHAGGPNQRFDAKVVSNLTELWRLSLHGGCGQKVVPNLTELWPLSLHMVGVAKRLCPT